MRPPAEIYAEARIESLLAGCLSAYPGNVVEQIERDGLWEYVASRACDEQIGGALLRALRSARVDLPRSTRLQLDSYRQHVSAANEYTLMRTEPVLRHLRAKGVSFMLLKGAALNASLYEHLDERGMVDIDLVIRPEDVERVDQVLVEAGCSRGPDLVREDFYPRYYYEREYATPDVPAVKLDVHCRPLRPLRYAQTMPADALWDDPREVMHGDVPVLMPSPENMLIHLTAHAAVHGSAGLKWLYDIQLWLERYGQEIDPASLADKCRRWKLALPVCRALERVACLFGESAPGIVAAMRHAAGSANVLDRLALSQAPKDAGQPGSALLVNLLCTPGWRFRLGYLMAVLLPGRSHLEQIYPRRHPGWPLAAHVVRAVRRLLPSSQAVADPA